MGWGSPWSVDNARSRSWRLCGREATIELCSGHIEDSDYVERAKLLEEQEFTRNNLVNNLLVEFVIFDKGYRCIATALLTMVMIARSRVRTRNNVTMC